TGDGNRDNSKYRCIFSNKRNVYCKLAIAFDKFLCPVKRINHPKMWPCLSFVVRDAFSFLAEDWQSGRVEDTGNSLMGSFVGDRERAIVALRLLTEIPRVVDSKNLLASFLRRL